MFLNIITPCSRPENLDVISKTINIPKDENILGKIIREVLSGKDSNDYVINMAIWCKNPLHMHFVKIRCDNIKEIKEQITKKHIQLAEKKNFAINLENRLKMVSF
jgi:hypothetical protein